MTKKFMNMIIFDILAKTIMFDLAWQVKQYFVMNINKGMWNIGNNFIQDKLKLIPVELLT